MARGQNVCSLALGAATLALLVLLPAQASAFAMRFTWCGGLRSPVFNVSAVPSGTQRIEFQMTDLDVPSFRHGGGTVAFTGQRTIPCGALGSGFVGPSPPPPQVHTYEFTAVAMGADGRTLARATAKRRFPER